MNSERGKFDSAQALRQALNADEQRLKHAHTHNVIRTQCALIIADALLHWHEVLKLNPAKASRLAGKARCNLDEAAKLWAKIEPSASVLRNETEEQ